MTTHNNPFVHGHQHLTFRRVLLITDDDLPPHYRPLHWSQAYLHDEQVQLFPCIFCDDFALTTEGQTVPAELGDKCPQTGIVRAILYEVTAHDLSTPVHVGYARTAKSAQSLVDHLKLETAQLGRCWEISTAHLPVSAMQYLEHLADENVSTGLLFEVFRMPGRNAVGCKLLCTPWPHEPIESLFSDELLSLRELQVRAGAPEKLVELLHLAAAAGTRILILSRDVPELDELRKYQ